MKILHIDTAETWRGGQAQVFHLVDHLAETVEENHLLTPEGSELSERVLNRGLEVELHHHPQRGEWDLSAAWTIRAISRQRGIDLLHVHDSHGHGICWLGSLFFTLPPLIVTRRLELKVAQNWFSRRKYRTADHFIAISSSVRETLVECGLNEEDITVIPSGIDLAGIRSTEPDPELLEELVLDPDRPLIGNVGALTRQKDQRTFIRAAARVREQFPEARFVIAGKGTLREDLEALIGELDLEDHVTLAGFQENIIGLIRTFDLFVLTSIFEGLCSTLLQVMACRVPIIATEVGGVPELIEHDITGLLTPPESPGETAAAIERFLGGDEAFSSYIEEAYDRVRAYDYPKLAERTVQVYQHVLS